MANPEHLELLRQGVDVWNAWRSKEPSIRPDLSMADLSGADLSGADLNRTYLAQAKLMSANLVGANLCRAYLVKADLTGADLTGANLFGAKFSEADLTEANLRGANLSVANLIRAHLSKADLTGAKLIRAHLFGADLSVANLTGADLTGANLSEARLVETNLVDATLTGCRVYGISAWNVKRNERTKQKGLIITPSWEPAVTVDGLEVAQFVYLLLHNEKIRDVIDTVGKKGVLLLGRFTEGRIAVLERLREELRQRGYLPIVFNFEKPGTKTFTETIRVLAGLSRFVIADVTDPQSVPAELQAVVPTVMVPFLPIIEKGKKPFALLEDLRIEHSDRMFKPFSYPSLDSLAAALEVKIIKPAETRFAKLQARKKGR